MKSIRKNIFETNSSSTHSISFCNDMSNYSTNLFVEGYDDCVHVNLGQFGWQVEDYGNTYDKLSYLLTFICQVNGLISWCDNYSDEEIEKILDDVYELSDFKEIESCIMSNINCSGIRIDSIEGYIDHQSIYGDTLQEYLSVEGVDSVQTYLFGDVVLHTDNDNH